MATCLQHRRVLRTFCFWCVQVDKRRIFYYLTGVLIIIYCLHTFSPNPWESFRKVKVREEPSMVVNLSDLFAGQNFGGFEHVGFAELNNSNCIGAFNGTARNRKFKKKVRRLSCLQIAKDAKDCKYFRKSYGLERYPPPLQEEEEFPIAFSIVFHTDLDQVLYLLRAIYRPQNVYCLHVDKKSKREIHAAVRSVVECLPNIFIASRLENVIYAGYSRLQADLTCMKNLLAHPVRWRYFINLVGQQFPLKSNLEMVRILKLYNGSNDIEGITGFRRQPIRFRFRYGLYRHPRSGVISINQVGGTNPPPPHKFRIVKGSVFGTFSRAFVRFVLHDSKVADLLLWSRHVYSPDEYVWATLHHSGKIKVPGGYRGDLRNKPWLSTYANWGGFIICYGIRVRGVCIFSPRDLPELLRRHEFTANKFYITEHPGALHCMDQLIYNLTVSYTVRDINFYKDLPFVTKSGK